MNTLEVRPVLPGDLAWVQRLLQEQWGETRIVSRGLAHQADALPAFAAVLDGSPAGLVTYRIAEGQCEVVSLNSLVIGGGRPLIEAVRGAAIAAGCGRLWLITTNDNIGALRFYQKIGFTLVTIHRNALDESRRLKPSIPLIGIGGIPLRDEIELEIVL
jgi:GNAT superfamily N-acetyltransferase